MPSSDQDSSPEPSQELDSPMEEEDEELEEVEEEVEVEEEEEEIEVDEEEEKREDDDDGEYEFEEVVEEVEEEEEEEEEETGDEDEGEAEDASKNLESEGHDEDQELVSITHEMPEINPVFPDKEATGSDLLVHDAASKILAVNTKGASVDRTASQDKHISEEKEYSKSLVDEKEVSLEKKLSNEDPEHIKNSYLEAHGSRQSNLSSSAEKAGPSKVQTKKSAETDTVRSSPKIGKSGDNQVKEASHTLLTTELKVPVAADLSSMHTPERRPRSASPGTTPENLSKRPAIVCAFYARGWCIKGKSCPFLHQKEEIKEILNDPSQKGDILGGTGSRGEAERLRMSSSQERPDLSNTESLSKSNFQVQRALVRAYGGESHGSPCFDDESNTNAGEELHKVDIPCVGGTLVRDDCKRPLGLGSQLDNMDEKQPASEIFLTRRYSHEAQLQQEMPKKEFFNDSPFSSGYSLMSSDVSEHRYYSGSSSTSSGLYLSNNNPVAHDRRTEDFAFRHQNSFPLHGSQSSYSSGGSLSSTFNSSHQPNPASSFSAEGFDIYKTFDLDKGYHCSRSSSLPRSSSPYLSRSEAGTGLLHNTPRDLPAFIRQKMEAHKNSWEPSVPFRPSFHYALLHLSSPGSQYDPLLDSIEPCISGNVAFQASERTINVKNFSGYSAEGDPLLHGSQMTEYNMEKTLSSISQSHEDISKKCKPEHGLSRQANLGVTARDTAIDWGNTSVPKEEKHRVPDHLVESANVKGADHDGDLKYEGEKNRTGKESKAMKFFRAALVDFVKELVKPSWREGHLSKDAHKSVVKRAVEKVLSSLQPHQIPSTAESINQYLSTSRPKLLKLVEGYIEKYAKSEATRLNMSEAA